jgi:hypothetical protein
MKRGPPTIETLRGKHASETIIVIGNSSSLNRMDMEIWDRYTTIGTNRLLRTYEPTYLLVVDKSVLRDEHERMMDAMDRVTYLLYPGMMGSEGRQIYPGSWLDTGPMVGGADPTSKTGPIDIGHVGNSGYEATQIAFRMGASRILLAGIDLFWPTNGQTHNFGSGKEAGCRLHKPDEITEDFATLKRLYAHCGVELTSISPWSTPLRRRLGFIDPESLT